MPSPESSYESLQPSHKYKKWERWNEPQGNWVFWNYDSKKWRLICKLGGTTAFCYVHDVPEFQSELSLSQIHMLDTYVRIGMGCFENKKFCENFYGKSKEWHLVFKKF